MIYFVDWIDIDLDNFEEKFNNFRSEPYLSIDKACKLIWITKSQYYWLVDKNVVPHLSRITIQ